MLELSSAKKNCIGIIGNLNIDLSIRNLSALPQWGQEVIGEKYDHVAAGQAANTAMALAKLGQTVEIIGNVGDDYYGQLILNTLDNLGVHTSEIEITSKAKTGLSVAVVRPDGERAFISDPACLNQFTLDLVKRHIDKMATCDLVCMVGNFFIPGLSLLDIKEIFQIIQTQGIPLLLDTGWDTGNWGVETIRELTQLLQLTDIFIPNKDEIEMITGIGDPQKAAESLQREGPEIVVVKLGSEGSFFSSNDTSGYVPALRVTAQDTVGAGDVFNAGFIHGFLQGWPLPACLQFGNSLSAFYITRLTNRFPDLREVSNTARAYNDYLFSERWV